MWTRIWNKRSIFDVNFLIEQSKDKKAYRDCFDRWRPKSEHSRELFNAYFQCLQDNIKRPIFIGLGCLSIIILPLIIYFRYEFSLISAYIFELVLRPDGCGEPDREKYRKKICHLMWWKMFVVQKDGEHFFIQAGVRN